MEKSQSTATSNAISCYHCGEPVPPGSDYRALIGGAERPTCCPGCLAVAQLISGSGMGSFYQLRTEFNSRPGSIPGADPQRYRIYDEEAGNSDFVTALESGEWEARLLVTGISCAACTWLIEKSLLRLPGVRRAEVNLAQHSLSVCLQAERTPLSEIFRTLELLGYEGHPWHAERGAEILKAEQRLTLRQLAVAGLAMMQVGMFAIALHAGDIQGMAEEYRSLLRWVSLLVATVVVFFSARPFFRSAWINLRHGNLVMDLPVAIAIGLAWSASTWATVRGEGQVYFDSVAMFTFFLLLARYLERRARQREMLRQTDLHSLLPASASRRTDQGWERVPSTSLRAGDTVQLAPGKTIPADGVIIRGNGSVNEAAFNGEPAPRALKQGDSVSAGTLLLEGSPLIEVAAASGDTRIAHTLNLVYQAGREKPTIVVLADRVAGYFVAAVLLVAAIVAWYWWQRQPASTLWICLSVLVVSCPCALALATPAAVTRATLALRRRGLLLGSDNSLQQLNGCDTIIFDKTGTLTRGEFSLQHTELQGSLDLATCLCLAGELEQHSNHPAARVFSQTTAGAAVQYIVNHPGLGVAGSYRGEEIRIGSATFARELNPALKPCPGGAGYWIVLCSAGETLAWFQLSDSLRPEAAPLLQSLKRRGLRVELLTGDSSPRGAELARELGMDAQHSGYGPAEKQDYIAALQGRGHRVIMVGDGLNDAPVLARADVSIAVSGATDLAKARADIIALGSNIATLEHAFEVAARCRRIVRQNIGWALAYNTMMIPLAAAGLIAPWAAAIGMSASSLLVVGNSLRLR